MLWVISLVSRDKEGLNQRLETSIQAYSPPWWKDIEHNRSRTPPEYPLIDKIAIIAASYPTKLLIQVISWGYYCKKNHFWECNSTVSVKNSVWAPTCRQTFLTTSHNMHIFALPISVMVTTAGNGARFCATLSPKIGPRKCVILTLRRLSVVHRKVIACWT